MRVRTSNKPRRCSVPGCRNPATTVRGLLGWCSVDCGAWLAEREVRKRERKAERDKREERKRTKARLREMRPIRDFLADAQAACNAYVRLRDARLPCISCGKPAAAEGEWHASHFRSRAAAPELRFDLDNLHRACAQCNLFLSGNLIEYRKGLVARIGLARVERLEGPHQPVKWTREGLAELRRHFLALARKLT